jgi:DNA-binding PadR family transcriptional regulator
MARRTELLKGCTETMVLKLLAERSMYGYELMGQIRERSDGAFALGQGTVYPLLYTLERKGLIRAEWEKADGPGRRKKFYLLTRKGAEAVSERVEEWRDFVLGMNRVLGLGGA